MRDDRKTNKAFARDVGELRSQHADLKKPVTGNISAEFATEEARLYAESIVDAIREPLLVLDADLKIISANRHFYTTFNVTPSETLGCFIYALGNNQWDIPALRELLEDILPEKQALDDFEVAHDFPDIGHKVMLLNARQIDRKDIDAGMILLAIEDITERRRLEDILTESEERFRRVFETAIDGIVLLEQGEGKITHANPAFEKMLGYTAKESIGKKLQDIGISLDLGDFQAIMERLNKNGMLMYDDVPAKTKAGEHIDTDIYLVDKEKYRLVVDNIADVITVMDLNLRFTYVSPSIIRLRGYTAEEVMAQTMEQIMTPESFQMVAKAFEEELKLEAGGMADPGRTRILELEEYRKDGSIVCLQNHMSALRDNDKKLIGIIALSRDITERKQAEAEQENLQAQLMQAQRMESVGRLAGGVAHDFNNKLTVILGYAQMAMEGVNKTDPIYANLQQVMNAGKHSVDIVRKLLAFARKQIIAPEVLDLNETVEGLFKMLRRLIGENIDVLWSAGHDLWEVEMDPSQIDQILANLCVNGRDAISGVGKITIETRNTVLDEAYRAEHAGATPGEYVTLSVSDNGCGMDKETRENIFEPFFTTKEVGEGTGLGLATVYGIVKQNKGFIDVASEPGKGTVFRIYLPRHSEEAEEKSEALPTEVPRGRGETILVVEDETSVLHLARRILENLGYAVLTSANPVDAIRMAREHEGEIRLLLTDVVLPKMSGKDLAREIAKIRPDIRTLFMSGYTVDVIAHQGVLDEDVQFIQKPFTFDRLARKVRETLGTRNAEVGMRN
ncbi:MAG: PAS domain S-box protein [Deltaproteobacteria bacterium]